MAQDLSVFKSTKVARLLQLERDAVAVMANLVNRQYESEVQEGDEVDVRFVPNMTVSNVPTATDGTEITFQELGRSLKKIKLNRWKTAAARINKKDMAQMVASGEVMQAYIKKAGMALADDIDVALLGQAVNSSLATVGTAGTDLTDAKIREGKRRLDNAKVPRSDRHLAITPDQEAVLLGIDKYFQAADIVGKGVLLREGLISDEDDPTPPGFFGRIYGINVWSTTNVTNDGGSPLATRNLMFHRDALALAVQSMPVLDETTVWWDPDEKTFKFAPDNLYGIKTLRTDHMVMLLS